MIPQIGYTDFPKICRLCLNERELINILDRADLVELYIRITNITVSVSVVIMLHIIHANIL